MPEHDPFLVFARRLRAATVAYMISGSVAAAFYGEPRLTNDLDVVIFADAGDAPRIEAAFPADEFYCPPSDVLRFELAREQRGHFNLIHHATGYKADVYPSGGEALHHWARSLVRHLEIGGVPITIAPPEYVMVRKLQFYREGRSPKHLRDISGMLVGLGPNWDRTALVTLIREHGLEREWGEATGGGR